jgi:crotonobetainyl-CoA:carnitine CoA-transferase CaiB-like acyl-CoA transferase
MLLADFGAEVIKIEPTRGDQSRRWGQHRFGEQGDFSGLFLAWNRNKTSVVLDLKTADGQRAVRALLATADVVVENFKPGVADRLGIGYKHAAELSPKVIYCSISGFGQVGPMRDRPGMDMLLQAYAGLMSITGEADRPSVRIGPAALDLLSGTNAALGIVLALRHRDQTGEGQRVSTSLYESALHLMSPFIADYTGSGVVSGKAGRYFAFGAPYGMFMGRDREFFVGCSKDQQFEKLCRALNRLDLLEDARFKSNADRLRNQETLYPELIAIFEQRDAQEWIDLFIGIGLPASLVRNVAEVAAEEQALATEMIVDSGVDGVKTAGIPIKLDRSPGSIRTRASSLGADTEAVLASLAMARGTRGSAD